MPVTHCPVCLGREIPPDGPTPCPTLFCGEAPGRDEVREGRPFVGRAGKEFNLHYLPLAGLMRDEVFVTNACRSARPGYLNPAREEAHACSRFHLPGEVRHCRPETIVPMGAVACSLFDTPIDLDTEHGLPQQNSLLNLGVDWGGTVFPVYHPAAGLHEGQYILRIRQDFANLGRFLRGELELPQALYPNRYCRSLQTRGDLVESGLLVEDPAEIAIDTEGSKEAPFCLSFAFQPDRGYVVKTGTDALAYFIQWVEARQPSLILHYYLHDAPVLRALGLPEIRRYTDTMQLSYVLGDQPQGLKALAYRLLGMRMRSYEDVTYPYSRKVAYEWLEQVECACANRFTSSHTLRSGPRKGQTEQRVRKPEELPLLGVELADHPALAIKSWRKVQRVLADRPPDPWARWDNWEDWDREFLARTVGGDLPRPSLEHVPEQEAVEYAATDAIATWRLKTVLERMARGFRKEYYL